MKLHELLAVESDLAATYNHILEETTRTFNKKDEHFYGFNRHLEWFEEGNPAQPEEHKAMDTTVQDKLDYQKKHIVRYLDAVLQKETANQTATADIMVDGVTIAANVPVAFLLNLEKKLDQIKQVYRAIPTLPPSIDWIKDESKGANVYRRKYPEEQLKTEKMFKVQVLYDATKEHPAQVEKIPETKNVGKYIRHVWTGVMSPAEKSAVLERIDKLQRAVKKARQRANSIEFEHVGIGTALFDYIHQT